MVKFVYDTEGQAVPENVTQLFVDVSNIPNKSFHRFNSLETVILSNKVGSIGDRAFEACGSLEQVQFSGRGVTSIGEDSFHSCEKLENIRLPDGLKEIGLSAFQSCKSLKSLYIPDSVEKVDQFAFRECTDLSVVIVPGSVSRVHNSTFFGCRKLVSVVLSEGIEEIGDFAFVSNARLTIVEIPESVDEVHKHSFYDCDALSKAAGNKDVVTFVKNRFDGLPMHRLLYQRHFVDSTALVLGELKDIHRDNSNAMKLKDVFGYTAKDILRYTSSAYSNIDDSAILKWFDNPTASTNSSGRTAFDKATGRNYYNSTQKETRTSRESRNTAQSQLITDDVALKQDDDFYKDSDGNGFKNSLLQHDLSGNRKDSGFPEDKDLYGDDFKKNLLKQDIFKVGDDTGSSDDFFQDDTTSGQVGATFSRETSQKPKDHKTRKTTKKPGVTNSDLFPTAKMRDEVALWPEMNSTRPKPIEPKKTPRKKNRSQTILETKGTKSSNMMQDDLSKPFSMESMQNDLMSGTRQNRQDNDPSSRDSMQNDMMPELRQEDSGSDDDFYVDGNDNHFSKSLMNHDVRTGRKPTSKFSSQDNDTAGQDNEWLSKEPALSDSKKPVHKISAAKTRKQKHADILSNSTLRDEVPLFYEELGQQYDATNPMQKGRKNRARSARGDVHLTFLPQHDDPAVRGKKGQKMTRMNGSEMHYYGEKQQFVKDDSKKQRRKGNPHMDV